MRTIADNYINEGLEKGMVLGMEKGKAEGIAIGEARGAEKRNINRVCILMTLPRTYFLKPRAH